MKFCGLISGGKDSIFNVIKAIEYGHQLVCLANLKPKQESVQELDSFMFQTVGHTVIQQIADAIGVPLIRREFDGSFIWFHFLTWFFFSQYHNILVAKQKDITYDSSKVISNDDEVEDLYELIKDVKERFPDIEGIASGAVLSNYQRNRVENVCQRLGLVSLAFLWRRDQQELLDDMIDNYDIEGNFFFSFKTTKYQRM